MENNVFNELPLLLTVPRAAQLLGISSRSHLPPRSVRRTSGPPTRRPRIHRYRRTSRSSGIVNDFVYQCASQWYSSLGPEKDPATGKYPCITKGGFRTEKEAWKARREAMRETDHGTLGMACHSHRQRVLRRMVRGRRTNHHSTQPAGRTGRTTPTPTSCLASANTLQRFHEPQLLSLDTTLLAEGHIMCNRDTEM